MDIPEQEGSHEPGPGEDLESSDTVEPTITTTIPRTRISRLWVRSFPALIALVIVLILVVQNRAEVTVRFFNGSLRVPLSVALLGAMVLGAFIMLGLGSLRVLQLRRRVRWQDRSKHGGR
ncbi:MAG: LapA family protein [Acidimicrobiales bacterium]